MCSCHLALNSLAAVAEGDSTGRCGSPLPGRAQRAARRWAGRGGGRASCPGSASAVPVLAPLSPLRPSPAAEPRSAPPCRVPPLPRVPGGPARAAASPGRRGASRFRPHPRPQAGHLRALLVREGGSWRSGGRAEGSGAAGVGVTQVGPHRRRCDGEAVLVARLRGSAARRGGERRPEGRSESREPFGAFR